MKRIFGIYVTPSEIILGIIIGLKAYKMLIKRGYVNSDECKSLSLYLYRELYNKNKNLLEVSMFSLSTGIYFTVYLLIKLIINK